MNMGWMVMTGMAGMMAWLLPACSATALAQCGMPCGQMKHDQARHQQVPPETTPDTTALHAPPNAQTERQTLPPCPVTGEPIVLSLKTMTDDGPVYFASEAARERFNAEPAKYAENAAAQREALKKAPRVQVTCPVTGNPIDGKTQIFTRGKVVDFCCKNCVSKFDSAANTQADERAYDARLEASYTYQTRCPVSGDKIEPTVYGDFGDDLRVYFCCTGDRDAFMKGLRNRPAATTQPARERTATPTETRSRSESGNQERTPTHEGHGGHGGGHR